MTPVHIVSHPVSYPISLESKCLQLESRIKELEKIQEFILQSSNKNILLEEAQGCILHKGLPPGTHECSKCRNQKENTEFTYYSQRVDRYGYLMRSNALCRDCNSIMNKERQNTLNRAKKEGKIPPKPNQGDICSHCNRSWGTKEQPKKWHRDHDAIQNEFRGWLCGDCNMAKHDHRMGIS
jgi:hypothetical protein